MSRDIRLDVDFLGNMKTRKLIRELGDHGAICMVRLWSYVALHHPKGHMNGMTLDDLEDAAGWTGMRGAFASYATRMRWVDAADDGHLSVHDWEVHQGWVYHSEKRSEAARIGANSKWEKIRKQGLNAARIQGGNAGSNAPSPSPSPSPEDQSLIVPRAKPARFTVPTIEEVGVYCKARRNSVNPERFHAHYTANGWKVGKVPMKNWKAAIVTWEKN